MLRFIPNNINRLASKLELEILHLLGIIPASNLSWERSSQHVPQSEVVKSGEQVTFGGGRVERAAEIRGDEKRIVELLARADARVTLLWQSKPLFADDGSINWVPPTHPFLDHGIEQPIFLGFESGAPRFASDVSGWNPPKKFDLAPDDILDNAEHESDLLPEGSSFANLRTRMSCLSPNDAELVASAKALAGWHATHRYCARCGDPTVPAMAGWQRKCPTCKADHFCRTDPVVIMLVLSGNRLLLGRSHGWPDGMRSLLAGFIEPGETVEAAVRREVQEETSVVVGEVSYLASQPWPFPASLMIGCKGIAVSEQIQINTDELEDAEWVTREDVLETYAGGDGSGRPRRGAIADFLIRNWLADSLD